MADASSDTKLQLNAPGVVSKTIDGEVVIINLDTGAYFSLRGAGADAWDGVERGGSVNGIIARMITKYDATEDAMTAAVSSLAAELRENHLVVDADGSPEDLPPFETNGSRVPFDTLKLEKFTDMQDLLLIDPIHEVDEGGWPTAP